jgi:hypothetical protein
MDRKETPALMEPLLIAEGSRHRGELTDLTVEVAARSAGFRRSLPDGVRTALADLVRAVNCYNSNLIEGHDTHPVDIERALKKRLQQRSAQARPSARSEGAHNRSAVDRYVRTGGPPGVAGRH